MASSALSNRQHWAIRCVRCCVEESRQTGVSACHHGPLDQPQQHVQVAHRDWLLTASQPESREGANHPDRSSASEANLHETSPVRRMDLRRYCSACYVGATFCGLCQKTRSQPKLPKAC